MAEYIEREALMDRIRKSIKQITPIEESRDMFFHDSGMNGAITGAWLEVKKFPAADVAPVRHGRWSHLGGDEWCCTNCGEVIHTEGSWEKPDKKFCDECGAKMDLEGGNK